MSLDWTTVISTFIGAFLAAGTGYFFERRRENARIIQARQLLKVVITDDLKYAATLYDKAIDEWDKTKTVWFSTLNGIRESRFAYQNNKDWIHVFEDPDLRRRIFRYYLQSSELVSSLENQQRRKYEIDGRLNDVVRDIKQKDSSLNHEDAVKVAISYMQSENREYDNLQKLIPESIRKLSEFKREAQEI
ncbi:MAG: hypothetical protein EBU46_01740, partial [Nitrosomonadaceae bacterium]|nr:hypothetical protein [Nitrosomonadaceae bacterium]